MKTLFAVMYHNKNSYKFYDISPPKLFTKLSDALSWAKIVVDEHNVELDDDKSDPEYFNYNEKEIAKYEKKGLPSTTLNYIATSNDNTVAIWINIVRIHTTLESACEDSDSCESEESNESSE